MRDRLVRQDRIPTRPARSARAASRRRSRARTTSTLGPEPEVAGPGAALGAVMPLRLGQRAGRPAPLVAVPWTGPLRYSAETRPRGLAPVTGPGRTKAPVSNHAAAGKTGASTASQPSRR